MSGLAFDDAVTHATDLSASFYTHFQTAKNDISSRLEALDASGSKLSSDGTEINEISSIIVKLRKDLVDATPYLPTYDRGKCEQQLKALEESLSRHRAPKSKFSFKRKAVTPSTPSSKPVPSKSFTHHSPAPSPAPTLASVPSTTNLTLSSRTSAHLTVSSLVLPTHASPSQTASLPHSSDITLTDLSGCIVNLFPSATPSEASSEDKTTLTITALHSRALHRVVLVIPPIEGSVLLHDIQDSIVVVGCHQFRMHDSTNTTVLLHVLSNPIIEGSHDIRFGAYPEALRHVSSISFFQRPSKHPMAQDFDWIKPSPSPNWRLLDSASGWEEQIARIVRFVNDGVMDDEVARVLEGILPRG